MAKKGNVTHLNNDYTRQVAAAHTETKQLLAKRRRKRAVIMAAFFIVVFFGFRGPDNSYEDCNGGNDPANLKSQDQIGFDEEDILTLARAR